VVTKKAASKEPMISGGEDPKSVYAVPPGDTWAHAAIADAVGQPTAGVLGAVAAPSDAWEYATIADSMGRPAARVLGALDGGATGHTTIDRSDDVDTTIMTYEGKTIKLDDAFGVSCCLNPLSLFFSLLLCPVIWPFCCVRGLTFRTGQPQELFDTPPLPVSLECHSCCFPGFGRGSLDLRPPKEIVVRINSCCVCVGDEWCIRICFRKTPETVTFANQVLQELALISVLGQKKEANIQELERKIDAKIQELQINFIPTEADNDEILALKAKLTILREFRVNVLHGGDEMELQRSIFASNDNTEVVALKGRLDLLYETKRRRRWQELGLIR
jgi:hypothetical protein